MRARSASPWRPISGFPSWPSLHTQASLRPLWSDSDESDKSPHFRCWLQAVGQRIAHYVGLTSSFGHTDIEFPLLSVQRTQADEPWAAAFDPKETIKTELRKPNRRLR